jgi:hypothetical protein
VESDGGGNDHQAGEAELKGSGHYRLSRSPEIAAEELATVLGGKVRAGAWLHAALQALS